MRGIFFIFVLPLVFQFAFLGEIRACSNIFADGVPNWSSQPFYQPVMTCVGKLYPGNGDGTPQIPGSEVTRVQACCDSPSYTLLKTTADCRCRPTGCITQWNIAAGAGSAIRSNQYLNLVWQHAGRGSPTFANVPAPSASSEAASLGTGAATAAGSTELPISTFDPVSGLNPASVNLFNAVHQVYQQVLSQ